MAHRRAFGFSLRIRRWLRESVSESMTDIPKSKSGQLADLLRSRLAAGSFGGKLPSERRLAEEFLVSRTTLRQALGLLMKENWIRRDRAGRGGWMAAAVDEAVPRVGLRQVVVLTLLSGSSVLYEQLASLRDMLGRSGLPVLVQEAGALVDRADPKSSLLRMVGKYPESIWILNKMPESVQSWFAASGLPAVIFGSGFPGVRLPSVDIDFYAVARHATGLCLARGCRRITLLTNRIKLAGDTRTVDGVREQLALAGAPPPRVMHHDFHREQLMDALDREIVARPDACDALIIVSQHHLMTALPHLLRRGVRIPGDLALVYLSNDPSVERLSPVPVRYDAGSAHVRRVVQAVRMLAGGGKPSSGRIIPKMLEGETIAPLP